jgi:protein-S-isoprenylcysteine O-methyltransferase Ste14
VANPDGAHRAIGTALVLLQFVLIVALALAAVAAFLDHGAPAGAWLPGAGGIALGLWAVSCNRIGNFNIRPDPRPGGKLVDRGPYRWIRHPMYTAVIACGVACALVIGTAWGWIGAAALVLVLVVKAAIEERWMLVAHPDYRAYRAGTKRFVPWVI